MTIPTATPTAEIPDAAQSEAETTAPQASREAAKYRTQLRAVEAERDALTGQLDAMRRAELGRHAKAANVSLDAVIDAGHTPETLVDETGAFDPDKIDAALTDARTRYGSIVPSVPSSFGQGNVGTPIVPEPETATWHSAISGTGQ